MGPAKFNSLFRTSTWTRYCGPQDPQNGMFKLNSLLPTTTSPANAAVENATAPAKAKSFFTITPPLYFSPLILLYKEFRVRKRENANTKQSDTRFGNWR